jgi:hypothetical protein
LISSPLRGGQKEGFPLNQNGGFNGRKRHPNPLLKGEGEVLPPLSGEFVFHFPPLSGEDKGGVSFNFSPSQGENERGGFRFGGVILIPSSQRLPFKNLVIPTAPSCDLQGKESSHFLFLDFKLPLCENLVWEDMIGRKKGKTSK